MEDFILGIDLGTTNTLAATVFKDGPEVIGKENEMCIIPSILSYQKNSWIVGNEAKPFQVSSPTDTVFSIKRLIGKNFEEIKEEIKYLPYKIKRAERDKVNVVINKKLFSPQELSALILKTLKTKVENTLGHKVLKAVITVPAYFDETQRQATKDAASIAGFQILRIINEPTAAAIAYGLDKKEQGYIAIYDLGGGTFDISILEIKGKLFKVISTHGNTQLGGDDIDKKIFYNLIKKIKEKYPYEKIEHLEDLQLIRTEAEKIKISLSNSNEYNFSFYLKKCNKKIQGVFHINELNNEIKTLVEKTFISCQKALNIAGLKNTDIKEVVLVGGTTLIPYIRNQVKVFFDKSPHVSIDPYKVVAIGASIHGHLLSGGRRDFILLDVIPLALGIETLGGTFSKLILGNSSLPAEEKEIFTTNVDSQNVIEINIYQGERELVKDCRCIGKFKLKGLPQMKAGLPLVEVTFNVDSNGLLKVSAYEKRSKILAQIEVIPSHGLTRQEVDTIIEKSIEEAENDFISRQLIEFRLMAKRMIEGIIEHKNFASNIMTKKQFTLLEKQMKIVNLKIKQNNPKELKSEIDKLGELTAPIADSIMGKAVLKELTRK